MTVTFIDAPGPLTNTEEPMDFTSTYPVTSISVEFNPALGNGAREMVFDGTTDDVGTNGDFSYQYRASSKPAGNVGRWTIRRDARWPATFRLRVKERLPNGGATYPEAILQPNLYGAVGMYALQGAGDPTPTRVYADRSGYGYHLNAGQAAPHTDLIPGQTCYYPLTYSATQAERLRRTTLTALQQISGELTLTMRCKRDVGGDGAIIVFSGIYLGGSDITRCTQYSLGSGADGALSMFWEAAAGATNNVTRFSSVGLVPAGQWGFLSFRRALNGVCTFGWNANYSSAAAAPLPVGGSQAYLNIGNSDEAGNVAFEGDIADVCIWPARLTDDQLTPLRNAAMGI